MEIKNFNDLKALAILKNIPVTTELPLLFGYKSAWGLKYALKNPKTKDKILKKAEKIFKL